MRAVEFPDAFDIDLTPIRPADEEDPHPEPIFLDGPLWIDFDDADWIEAPLDTIADEPLLVGFEEFALSDAPRLAEDPEPPAPGRTKPPASGLACSLAVHLLALLVLVSWSTTTGEVLGTIPVRLVIEDSAAAPKQAPGQEVAQDSEPAPRSEAAATASAAPSQPPPANTKAAAAPPALPPAEAKLAAAGSSPKPPTPPPVKPAPTPVPRAAAQAKPLPQMSAHPEPATERVRPASERPAVVAVAPAVSRNAPAPMPAVANGPARAQPVSASVAAPASLALAPPAAGAGSGRGDYFAELEKLTRPYLYMLSPSFLAGRRGRVTLSLMVRDDGSVSDIAIKRSSGYPDIDQRIEKMIAAVGRFPPLPAGLRRPGADLDFNLVFPEVLQQ